MSKEEPAPAFGPGALAVLQLSTVKTNFLSEDNKVSVHFTEVRGCTDFVNNIAVDVFSQHAYAAQRGPVNIQQYTSDLWANQPRSSFQLPIGIDFHATPSRILMWQLQE